MSKRRRAESIAALALYAEDDDAESEEEDLEELEEGTEEERDDERLKSETIRSGAGETSSGQDPSAVDALGIGYQNDTVNHATDEEAAENEEETAIPKPGLRTTKATPPGKVHILTPPNKPLPSQKGQSEALELESEQQRAENVPPAELSAEVAQNGGNGASQGDMGPSEGETREENEGEAMDEEEESFLPPLTAEKCDPVLQQKFAKYLHLKTVHGKHLNDVLRLSKGYRNPNFMQQAVQHQEIDETGTCFRQEVFDPRGYHPGDFLDQLHLEVRRHGERKEEERKQRAQIDFQKGAPQGSGGVQGQTKPLVQVVTGQKGLLSLPPGVSPLLPGQAPGSEGRQRKRSKWDKTEAEAPRPEASRGFSEALGGAKPGPEVTVVKKSQLGSNLPRSRFSDGDLKSRGRS